mmetsp:Transcript_37469/g.99595  ORF Transcript_37469/g.99595 Transcript_37469/m.99595 type:complete len:122 (-) Transcript_37469:676-1041(-)
MRLSALCHVSSNVGDALQNGTTRPDRRSCYKDKRKTSPTLRGALHEVRQRGVSQPRNAVRFTDIALKCPVACRMSPSPYSLPARTNVSWSNSEHHLEKFSMCSRGANTYKPCVVRSSALSH